MQQRSLERVRVGIGILASQSAWVLFKVGIEGMVISPIVRFGMVMSAAERSQGEAGETAGKTASA